MVSAISEENLIENVDIRVERPNAADKVAEGISQLQTQYVEKLLRLSCKLFGTRRAVYSFVIVFLGLNIFCFI